MQCMRRGVVGRRVVVVSQIRKTPHNTSARHSYTRPRHSASNWPVCFRALQAPHSPACGWGNTRAEVVVVEEVEVVEVEEVEEVVMEVVEEVVVEEKEEVVEVVEVAKV